MAGKVSLCGPHRTSLFQDDWVLVKSEFNQRYSRKQLQRTLQLLGRDCNQEI